MNLHNSYKLVIVGFGFGGLSAYKEILKNRRKIDLSKVLIIDKNGYFLYSPLLHEASSGVLDYDDITIPIHEMVNNRVKVLKSLVEEIDIANNKIITKSTDKTNLKTATIQKIDYEYLILATGSSTNFLNIPGADKYSLELKSVKDILAFHKFFKNLSKDKQYNINIVGGGPDGVELSTEIADRYGSIFNLEINLFQSGDIILKEYSNLTQNRAEEMLKLRRVNLRKNTPVVKVKKNSVCLSDGTEIPSDLTVWVAGITTNPPKITLTSSNRLNNGENLENVNFKKLISKFSNRLPVNNYLQLYNPLTKTTYGNIFIVGDGAYLPNIKKGGIPYPMLAQVASRQAQLAVQNITRMIKKQELLEFKYQVKGQLLAVSRYNAGGNIINLEIKGFWGWIFWKIFYFLGMPSFKKKLRILYKWIKTNNLFN